MPQEWDEKGNPIQSQQWDENGKPISLQAGQPITDTSTLRAAPSPSTYEQIVSPVREVMGPVVSTFMGDKVGGTEAAPGTWVKNAENLTQSGRTTHPVQAGIGDIFRGMRQFTKMISPEAATLGVPEAGSTITEAAPKMSEVGPRMLRNERGEIAITPSSILDRIVPQRPEILEKQTEEELRAKTEAAESARQKELAQQERLREQDARARMRRGKEQSALDAAEQKAAGKKPVAIGGETVTTTAGPTRMGPPSSRMAVSPTTTTGQAPVKMVSKFERPEPSRIVEPGSTPPMVKRTYQSIPQQDLKSLVMEGDRGAIEEWRRRGLELPSNVGYMVESGAANRPWRSYKR
jgi:hypothetical protein